MITQCNYKMILGTSLVAHWLKLWASSAGGTGSIPGRGTKILYAGWCGQKNNKKRRRITSFLNLTVNLPSGHTGPDLALVHAIAGKEAEKGSSILAS